MLKKRKHRAPEIGPLPAHVGWSHRGRSAYEALKSAHGGARRAVPFCLGDTVRRNLYTSCQNFCPICRGDISSFPRKREPREDCWIPAFAGMTGMESGNGWQAMVGARLPTVLLVTKRTLFPAMAITRPEPPAVSPAHRPVAPSFLPVPLRIKITGYQVDATAPRGTPVLTSAKSNPAIYTDAGRRVWVRLLAINPPSHSK